MNNYRLQDLYEGMSEDFSVTVTDEMLNAFRNISGDQNPLHKDELYAKENGYPGRVAYGMLTASFLSTLAGMYLPGELSLIQGVELNFRKPVYIGNILSIHGTIGRVLEEFHRIELIVQIKNQYDELVLTGRMKVGVRE